MIRRHRPTTIAGRACPSVMAESLRVVRVVEGSVRVQDGTVYVTVQFVRKDGSIDSSESYDRPIRTAGSLHTDVAATSSSDSSSDASQAPLRRFRLRFEAWALHSRGRQHLDRRTPRAFAKRSHCSRTRSARSPRFARAHAGLADAYRLLAAPEHAGMSPRTRCHSRSVCAGSDHDRLDTRRNTHASLANATFNFDWDWAAAKRSFERALALDSASVTAHQWYGLYLAAMGDTANARRHARLVRQIEPKAPAALGAVARIHYLTRQPDTAIAVYRKALEQDSTFYVARVGIALSYLSKGQPNEAERELRTAMTLSPAAQRVRSACCLPSSPRSRGGVTRRASHWHASSAGRFLRNSLRSFTSALMSRTRQWPGSSVPAKTARGPSPTSRSIRSSIRCVRTLGSCKCSGNSALPDEWRRWLTIAAAHLQCSGGFRGDPRHAARPILTSRPTRRTHTMEVACLQDVPY